MTFQEWLDREIVAGHYPTLQEGFEAGRVEGREQWADAANKLIDYCEAHDWGLMPEPYDSINPLLELLGRAAVRREGA